jgi:hypothetical protein
MQAFIQLLKYFVKQSLRGKLLTQLSYVRSRLFKLFMSLFSLRNLFIYKTKIIRLSYIYFAVSLCLITAIIGKNHVSLL